MSPYREPSKPEACTKRRWVERWLGPPGSWGPSVVCERCGQRPRAERLFAAIDRGLSAAFATADVMIDAALTAADRVASALFG